MKIFDYKNNPDEVRNFIEKIKNRGETADVSDIVGKIIADVRKNGDAAVQKYTRQFDAPEPKYYEVPREVVNDALTNADEAFVHSLLNAQEKITAFHQRQKQNGFMISEADGVIMGQRVRGLRRAGIYVPGGTAAYPSSVLMNAIPAKIAGVGEIIMITPPARGGEPNPDILTAAAICGVDRIFMCGGAQAVAALAYGTAQIPKADKIVGPGNIFVAAAKKMLYGVVDIDMIAGPSEILIIADGESNPKYIAADLISQAEHDKLASAVLITTSVSLADRVNVCLNEQVSVLPRSDIINDSIRDWGGIILTETTEEAVTLADAVSPEHLEVIVRDPMRYVGKLDNVGSLFLGEYSPEPLGDYYAGPNHVLPTGGTAGFFSPLSVDSFIKKSSYIYYTKDALSAAAEDIVRIAESEKLSAHANAIKVRLENGGGESA